MWEDFYYSERTQFLRLTETSGNRQGGRQVSEAETVRNC